MKKIANRGYAAKDRPVATHYGRPIVMQYADGPVYILCSLRHVVERIDRADWDSHWMRERVADPKWNIECSIGGES